MKTMSMSPVLFLHILGGTVGILSGFVTVFLLKGSRRHSIGGKIFVGAMVTLTACGLYLAILKFQPGNILGALLTFYLVTTAWTAARRADGMSGLFDWGSLLVGLSVAAVELTCGVAAATNGSGQKFGFPPGPYFAFGFVALLAAIGDIRMLMRGGISGTARIARHLWRMCFGLFIASASLFLARPQLFPAFMQKTGALVFLSFLPLALMIFWLIRISFKKRVMGVKVPAMAGSG